MKRNHRRHAFSLLELVAVVTLIGIVAAVTMFRLQSMDRNTASTNMASENLRLLQGAIERYYFDYGAFPTSINDLVNAQYLAHPPKATDPGKSYSIDGSGNAVYQ